MRLAPRAAIAFGSEEAEPRLEAGFALDPTHAVLGVLRFGPPPAFALEAEGGTLTEVCADLLVPIAIDVALDTDAVQELLAKVVLGGTTVEDLLEGVVLAGGDFDPGVLNPNETLDRLLTLAANIADRTPSLAIDPLTVEIVARNLGPGDDVYGVRCRCRRPGAAAGRWRDHGRGRGRRVLDRRRGRGRDRGRAAGGRRCGVPAPFFGLEIRGVGLRFGRSSGPCSTPSSLPTRSRCTACWRSTARASSAPAGSSS